VSRREGALARIEARIERLEAFEAVRNVVARYAIAADARRGTCVDLESIMALFSAEATWDGGKRYGRHVGHENVRTYLSQGKAGIDWSIHQMVNVSLEFSDDLRKARGRWYLLEMARMGTTQHRPGLVFLAGIYDNEFLYENGEWKFSCMKFDCQSIVETPEVWLEPHVREER